MTQNEDADKRVAYYAACVESWFVTRMELDKSLLTLSAGGVGILVGFLSDAGLRSVESLILYILSLIGFLICIASVLYVLKANSGYLEQINQACDDDKQSPATAKLLSALDAIAIMSFSLAVLCTSIIGVSLAAHSFSESEAIMSQKNKEEQKALGLVERDTNAFCGSYSKAEAMKPKVKPDNKNAQPEKSASPKSE